MKTKSCKPVVSSLGQTAAGFIFAFIACAAGVPTATRAEPVGAYVYGIDDNNVLWQFNPTIGLKTPILNTGLTGGVSNALAYDGTRSELFFIGPDLNLYYYDQASGTSVAAVAGSGSLGLSVQPANAAYYNDAYWFFQENTNQLVKASLSYSGNVPSVAGVTTFSINNMGLPNPGTGVNTNTFGDIVVNGSTGILYAETSRGRFYSLDLNGDPTNTFQQIAASPGNDNTVGLQLAFNSDFSVLYGQNYWNGKWYTVDVANGAWTQISGFTTLPAAGVGLRDLGGAAAVPEPSAVVLAGLGGAVGFAWSLFSRRHSAGRRSKA